MRPTISDNTLISKIYEILKTQQQLENPMSNGHRSKQIILKRHTNEQQVHEKILRIINIQENAYQNHNESLLHFNKND